MKIELVCPAAEDSAFLRSRAVAVLAGLTPPDVQLSLRDDIIRRLDPATDLDLGADLAAISVSTKTAARAYQLADVYRRHGVKVVLGGIHPTALPEEAAQHCDAVVVGEAEGLWQAVVRDLGRSELRPTYRHEELPEISRTAPTRWDLFTSKKYAPVYPVQSSRGCPFNCDFCSVTTFFGRRLRLRDVDDVVGEIQTLPGRWIIFADDNIVVPRGRAHSLFSALKPLGLTWFGQASLQGLRDRETVKLMADSGCRGLFVGFESVNHESLVSCGKNQNDPEQYTQVVEMLQDHGIGVWASFVLGLDEDGPEVFERTLEFAIRSKVFMALFAMQTPYPGTPLYQRLHDEGRLLQPRWWLDDHSHDHPLYRPRRMTRQQLHEGWQWIWSEFYSASSILRRFTRLSSFSSLFSLLAYLPLNLHQRTLTTAKILGGDRFFRRDR